MGALIDANIEWSYLAELPWAADKLRILQLFVENQNGEDGHYGEAEQVEDHLIEQNSTYGLRCSVIVSEGQRKV